MTNSIRLVLARDLVAALEQGNEASADSLLDQISDLRESQLFQEVGRLTRQLHDTMAGFSLDSKITQITENEIPDAKERLQYVITMTEQAANETLNAVEELLPVSKELIEQSSGLSEKWERFLDKEMPFSEFKSISAEIILYFKTTNGSLKQVQDGLNSILIAQGFQDVTGQIIKRVIDLVQDLETSMVELIRISGGSGVKTEEKTQPELLGPVVPGVDDMNKDTVANQDDVDDLLSSLGF